jgi:hypothetical protein
VAAVTTYVSTWEKVLVIATAVGGFGAMLGAIFAWLAARGSGQTARDARDALAASLKPQVHLVINSYYCRISIQSQSRRAPPSWARCLPEDWRSVARDRRAAGGQPLQWQAGLRVHLAIGAQSVRQLGARKRLAARVGCRGAAERKRPPGRALSERDREAA